MATALKITYPPEFTTEQYEAIVAKLSEQDPADGALFHWVEQAGDGSLIMHDVWESREDFDSFLEDVIRPIATDLGVTSEPVSIEETNVYHYLTSGVED